MKKIQFFFLNITTEIKLSVIDMINTKYFKRKI